MTRSRGIKAACHPRPPTLQGCCRLVRATLQTAHVVPQGKVGAWAAALHLVLPATATANCPGPLHSLGVEAE